MDTLVLVRHGECTKNLERRHGSVEAELTPVGVSQVQRIATLLNSILRGTQSTIWVVNRRYCWESAELMQKSLSDTPASVRQLPMEPYFLGVLDGLSTEEAKLRYPDVADRMDRYRAGLLDIGQVAIPGAADPDHFFNETSETLAMLTRESGAQVVLGTRSVLVGMLNVVRGNHPRAGGGYQEVPWDNCVMCRLDMSRTDGAHPIATPVESWL